MCAPIQISCTFRDQLGYATLNREHDIEGRLIPMGFKWNGASLKNWMTALVFVNPFHPDVLIGSLIHDWDYVRGLDRLLADRKFRDMWLERGPKMTTVKDYDCIRVLATFKVLGNDTRRVTHWMRGHAMYAGLRLGGWKTYNDLRRAK